MRCTCWTSAATRWSAAARGVAAATTTSSAYAPRSACWSDGGGRGATAGQLASVRYQRVSRYPRTEDRAYCVRADRRRRVQAAHGSRRSTAFRPERRAERRLRRAGRRSRRRCPFIRKACRPTATLRSSMAIAMRWCAGCGHLLRGSARRTLAPLWTPLPHYRPEVARAAVARALETRSRGHAR